jgi:hypothetical protein
VAQDHSANYDSLLNLGNNSYKMSWLDELNDSYPRDPDTEISKPADSDRIADEIMAEECPEIVEKAT